MKLIGGFLGEDELAACEQIADAGNHWAQGRQGTGYEKLDVKNEIFLHPFVLRALREGFDITVDYGFWDAYLLRYPDGAFIPRHVDEATMFGKAHHRLNVLIRDAIEGGDLIVGERTIDLHPGDGLLFRPDVQPHEVTPCQGERLVFTVGCWK